MNCFMFQMLWFKLWLCFLFTLVVDNMRLPVKSPPSSLEVRGGEEEMKSGRASEPS